MKTENKIIALSVAAGLLVWVIDAAIDAFFFYENSFLNVLVLDMEVFEIYFRSLILLIFIVFGILVSRYLARAKRAEQQLLESEERYRFYFENIEDVVYAVDNEFRVSSVSPSIETKLGYRPDEIVGRNVTELEFLAPEYYELAATNIARLYEGKRNPPTEFEFIAKDGSRVTAESVSAAVVKDGKVVEALAVARDVTERRKAEREVKKSLSLLNGTLESTADGILAVDSEGKIMISNGRFAEMWGIPQSIMDTKDDDAALEFVLNQLEKPEEFLQRVRNLYDQPDTESFDILKFKDERIFERYSVPLKIGDEIAGRVWSFRDVTQRSRAEAALLESERRYAATLDAVPDMVYEARLDGTVIYANHAASKKLGYSLNMLGAIKLIDLLDEEQLQLVAEVINDLVEKKMPSRNANFKLKTLDGTVIPVEANITLLERKGQPPTLLGAARDITPRLKAADEKKKLEARLLQAEKMESIGTLAGGIAHDFNNLLMVIQGNISLMLNGLAPNHPHYERLRSIEEQVGSGANLTDQLLGYARGGRYEIEPMDLNKAVKKIAEAFGRTRKGISIQTELAPDLRAIEADRNQIEQVLLNLFINAADAMANSGNLGLKTENVSDEHMGGKIYEPKPGRYVVLKVIDSGAGMDEETKKRIFEPFFTTKEMGRGTGLGLASVYGIVKGHGGYIDVDSEPGRGTTFSIYLPASAEAAAETGPIVGEISGGAETIMVVDDETTVLAITCHMLEELGYTPLKAKSGKEAIELFKQNKESIGLVILDMIMPDMHGGEVFDTLKQIDPNVKVLLASGYSVDGNAADILDRGCKGFLQKPFNLGAFSREIKNILHCE